MTINFRSVKHCAPINAAVKCAVTSFGTQFDHIDEKCQHFSLMTASGMHPMRVDLGHNAVLSRHCGRIEFRNFSQGATQHHEWACNAL